MARHAHKFHFGPDETGAGGSPQEGHQVLGISLMLSVASMSLIWLISTLIF